MLKHNLSDSYDTKLDAVVKKIIEFRDKDYWMK